MNEHVIYAFIDELEKIASSNPLMSKDSRHITYIKNEKDYYKTRDFYNKLGFEEETSWDDPGDKGSMFRIGKNTVIELMHDGERSTSPWRMSKRVQNVDKAHRYLSNKGIDASKPTTREWGDRDSTIYDPIGNRLTYFTPIHTKTAEAIAVKRDPQKWEQAKQEAKAKMGGKHSARAMQLAVKLYKDKGGTYSGKKPTPANNSMRKWTKQDWQTRPGTPEIAQRSDGSTSRYLPKKKWDNLSHKQQVATDVKKLNADSQYISNTSSAKVKGNAKYY